MKKAFYAPLDSLALSFDLIFRIAGWCEEDCLLDIIVWQSIQRSNSSCTNSFSLGSRSQSRIAIWIRFARRGSEKAKSDTTQLEFCTEMFKEIDCSWSLRCMLEISVGCISRPILPQKFSLTSFFRGGDSFSYAGWQFSVSGVISREMTIASTASLFVTMSSVLLPYDHRRQQPRSTHFLWRRKKNEGLSKQLSPHETGLLLLLAFFTSPFGRFNKHKGRSVVEESLAGQWNVKNETDAIYSLTAFTI